MLKAILEADLHHLSPHAVAFISELRCLHVVEGDGEMFVRLATPDESGVDSFEELRGLALESAAQWSSLYEVLRKARVLECVYVHFSNSGHVFDRIQSYGW